LEEVGDPERVDYPTVREHKTALLKAAHANLGGSLASEFADFRERNEHWVESFGLYMALKEAHSHTSWTTWSEDLRRRDPRAMADAAASLSTEVSFHVFCQFVFHRQLAEMRVHASARGVEIVGDVPLYVAPDSVDVWLNPELFAIDGAGEPSHVAGVPPDMFSESGQRWGNPLYRWDVHKETGYKWWADRLRTFFAQSDVLRIDHFTGLATYYDIEASNPTAIGGVWREGPGIEFFEAIENILGPLKVIVEDLGPAGQVVEDLRVALGFPGMEVLQELFVEDGPYVEIEEDRVVYTGTHDNDTARGRFDGETEDYRVRALRYTNSEEAAYSLGLVEAAWASPGVIAMAPMQDLLGLGTEARMNYPSTISGNWQWRMASGSASDRIGTKLSDLNQQHRRHT
jgi:4-alpha-glucanotransferase